MPDKYFDELDQEVQASSAGGGMICQVEVFGAYKVYAQGVPLADSVFLYGGKFKKDEARAKADALSETNGGRVEQTLCLVQYKDSVLGRDVGHWKGDGLETYGPFWGPDAQAFNERRKELGLKSAARTWVRIGSMTSPNAEANKEKRWAYEKDQDGNEILKRMLIPVAVFSDKAAAEEAAASLGTGASSEAVNDPSWPGPDSEWKDYDAWATAGKSEIRKMAAKLGTGVPALAKIAGDMLCSVEQVKLVLSEPSE